MCMESVCMLMGCFYVVKLIGERVGYNRLQTWWTKILIEIFFFFSRKSLALLDFGTLYCSYSWCLVVCVLCASCLLRSPDNSHGILWIRVWSWNLRTWKRAKRHKSTNSGAVTITQTQTHQSVMRHYYHANDRRPSRFLRGHSLADRRHPC